MSFFCLYECECVYWKSAREKNTGVERSGEKKHTLTQNQKGLCVFRVRVPLNKILQLLVHFSPRLVLRGLWFGSSSVLLLRSAVCIQSSTVILLASLSRNYPCREKKKKKKTTGKMRMPDWEMPYTNVMMWKTSDSDSEYILASSIRHDFLRAVSSSPCG